MIHKSQGKTLDLAIIYLGKSEKCSDMAFVALLRVLKLIHLLIFPILIERLKKVIKSNSLPIIRDAYAELDLNLYAMKEHFFWIVVIEFKIYSSTVFIARKEFG